MKKSILLLIVLMTTFISTAQITEVEKSEVLSKVSLLGDLIGELNKVPNQDAYFVSYKDFKFTTLTDHKSFVIGNKETVLQFKNIMLDMIKNKTKEKEIELEGNFIRFVKRANTIETYIINKAGVTSKMRWMNKKHINKLFPTDKLK